MVGRARDIPEPTRDLMMSESLALVFAPDIRLGGAAVIEAISEALAVMEDPLQKISILAHSPKKKTTAAAEAGAWLEQNPDFLTFRAIPRSEVGNSQTKWLTAAIAYNDSPDNKLLFFSLPRERVSEPFSPHLLLLQRLVESGLAPHYGFGYHREYGLGPDYYAIGHVYGGPVSQRDTIRLMTWIMEISSDPARFPDRHRYARGLILDVFPINVLTDVHLAQRVGDVSFREWIAATTGPDSLAQIGARCSVWKVPLQRAAELSVRLDEAGLIMAKWVHMPGGPNNPDRLV